MRLIASKGLLPEIWNEFTTRFGIARVCVLSIVASSEGNTASISISSMCTELPGSRRSRWLVWSILLTLVLRCATLSGLVTARSIQAT